MTIVLFVLTLAKFRLLASDNAQIESFRGASLREEDWNPLIAASVNEGVITLNIGSRTYTSEQIPMYMDNGLQLMIPVDLLRDALGDNEVSDIRELAELWESTSPSQQEIAAAMIRAVLERRED